MTIIRPDREVELPHPSVSDDIQDEHDCKMHKVLVPNNATYSVLKCDFCGRLLTLIVLLLTLPGLGCSLDYGSLQGGVVQNDAGMTTGQTATQTAIQTQTSSDTGTDTGTGTNMGTGSNSITASSTGTMLMSSSRSSTSIVSQTVTQTVTMTPISTQTATSTPIITQIATSTQTSTSTQTMYSYPGYSITGPSILCNVSGSYIFTNINGLTPGILRIVSTPTGAIKISNDTCSGNDTSAGESCGFDAQLTNTVGGMVSVYPRGSTFLLASITITPCSMQTATSTLMTYVSTVFCNQTNPSTYTSCSLIDYPVTPGTFGGCETVLGCSWVPNSTGWGDCQGTRTPCSKLTQAQCQWQVNVSYSDECAWGVTTNLGCSGTPTVICPKTCPAVYTPGISGGTCSQQTNLPCVGTLCDKFTVDTCSSQAGCLLVPGTSTSFTTNTSISTLTN